MTKRSLDFSDPDVRDLYRCEVNRRIHDFGMTREQAEMLVAVLMTDVPTDGEEVIGYD